MRVTSAWQRRTWIREWPRDVSGLSARREPSRAWRVVSRVTGVYMESARARRRVDVMEPCSHVIHFFSTLFRARRPRVVYGVFYRY